MLFMMDQQDRTFLFIPLTRMTDCLLPRRSKWHPRKVLLIWLKQYPISDSYSLVCHRA
uniref:Uncharacterized protein n=1 Tax=Arundo donax TaxID=35708 RepID=A0A0A8Y2D2_ARUDO